MYSTALGTKNKMNRGSGKIIAAPPGRKLYFKFQSTDGPPSSSWERAAGEAPKHAQVVVSAPNIVSFGREDKQNKAHPCGAVRRKNVAHTRTRTK